MNEIIEVQFKKNGKRLRVKRQRPGGIEFDERDPLERTVGIKFSPDNEITRMRMDSIRRIQGWDPGVFKLKMGVEDGRYCSAAPTSSRCRRADTGFDFRSRRPTLPDRR